MEIIFYCTISFVVGFVIMFFLGAKFRKPIIQTEYVVDEDLVADLVQEELEEMNRTMLKIPIELRNYNKIDAKKCEECAKKAESLGVDMEVACPDLDCDEDDNNDFTVEKTNDYIRPEDIKGFLPIKEGVNISFYDGQVIRYSITEKEFIKKFSQFVNII